MAMKRTLNTSSRKKSSPTHRMASLAALFAAATLAACGGGGSSSSAPAPAPTPVPVPAPSPAPAPAPSVAGAGQGIFTVKTPDNIPFAYSMIVTILENGEYYAVASDNIGGYSKGAFDYATITGSNGTFTSTDALEFPIYVPGLPGYPISLNGTYSNTQHTSNVGFTLGGVSYLFNLSGTPLTYSSTNSQTIYDHPIAITSIAGNYSGGLYGKLADGASQTVALSSFTLGVNGQYSANAGSCTITGSIIAHKSTGVFDTTAAVTGSGCLFSGDLSGIVTPVEYTNMSSKLLVQLFSTDKKSGFFLAISK